MRKTERNGENWFIGHMQRHNGNRRGIDDDDDQIEDPFLSQIFEKPLPETCSSTFKIFLGHRGK